MIEQTSIFRREVLQNLVNATFMADIESSVQALSHGIFRGFKETMPDCELNIVIRVVRSEIEDDLKRVMNEQNVDEFVKTSCSDYSNFKLVKFYHQVSQNLRDQDTILFLAPLSKERARITKLLVGAALKHNNQELMNRIEIALSKSCSFA